MFDTDTQPQSSAYWQNTKLTIPLLLIVLLFGSFAYGRVIYVDDDTAGANDGTSWENAYVYLQDALANADSAPKPVEIRVAQGVYKPAQGSGITPGDRDATFQLIDGVTIKGGYAGFGEAEPGARDAGTYETILSGDLNDDDSPRGDIIGENSYHVLTGSGTAPTAILDCFTISAGAGGIEDDPTGDVGGGMYNFKGSPTLLNCTFVRNSVGNGLFSDGYGGGMYNSSSSPTLIKCTFNGNWAARGWRDGNGGGMYNSSSDPVLIGCTFSGNYGDGGGMFNRRSSPMLLDCTFTGNSDGGMYNSRSSPMLLDCTFTGNTLGGMQNSSGSDPTLINCTFSGNVTRHSGPNFPGPGIDNSWGSLTIVNCTFTGNSGAGEKGKALACEMSDVQVINSILWDGGNEISRDDDSHITITHSDVQGGWPGEHNIDIDPFFAKPGYWDDSGTPDRDQDDFWVDGDYRLKSQAGRWDPNAQTWIQDALTSPCIDAGDNSALPPWLFADLNGHARITNGTVDMGAYESSAYESPEAGFVLSSKGVRVPESGTTTFAVRPAQDPLGIVEVSVAQRSGDADIQVLSGALLSFDSSNYTRPQSVKLTAAEDGDYLRGMALIWVSAPGLASAGLIAGEWDNDAPAPLYVDADAAGANNGSSWAAAFVNLQDALSRARMNLHIEQIRVAQGIYRPDRGQGITPGDKRVSFELIDGVALMGAYAGWGEPDPNVRDIKQYEAILSGDLNGNDAQVANAADLGAERTRADNARTVVRAGDRDNHLDATAVLDGFTITDANGGGMRNTQASTTVSNCTFRGNSGYDGGGMYNSHSSPTLTNCTFSGNASDWGGGMANYWSNPTLINCTFSANYAASGGGAIGDRQDSNLTLINCTFSGNSTERRYSGAIQSNYVSDSLVLTDCIVWGNSGDSISLGDEEDEAKVSVSYSNIQGGWPGVGNIDTDPLFADPDGPDNIPGTEDDDLRLSHISPCVDSGDPNYVPEPNETDRAGNARIANGRIDMGAYEFQGLTYVDGDPPDDPGPGDPLE